MTTPETWMDEAEQMVVNCEEFDDLVRLVANWMDMAAQYARNTDYYRDLLDRCGKAIGDRAYTQDDGGRCEDVLCAKIPEIIEADYPERCYTTRSSAHGSGYVPLSNPEKFEMTLEEAENDVRNWASFADTVGGDAIVVRDPTR